MELANVIAAGFNALETRIKSLEEQLTAMQQANNQLTDIAFDENRFTQQLLEKVDDTAREAVKESLDYDEIAREVPQYIDADDVCERVMDNLDVARLARDVAETNAFSDKVQDHVEEYVNDNNLLNADEVDEAIGDYIERNYDIVQHGQLREMLDQTRSEIVQQAIESIATRLGQTPAPTPSNGAAAHVHLPQTSLQEGGSH